MFNINHLDGIVYSRFIELLNLENNYNFSLTNKVNYIKCIKHHGIIVEVIALGAGFVVSEFGNISISSSYELIPFESSLQYFSKFVPYFNFHGVEMRFGLRFPAPELDIPKMYKYIAITEPESMEDIDFIQKHYYHSGIISIVIDLCSYKSKTAKGYLQILNYCISKMPDVQSFIVKMLSRSKEEIESSLHELKLPSSNKKITLLYDLCYIYNVYYALRYSDRQWDNTCFKMPNYDDEMSCHYNIISKSENQWKITKPYRS